MKIFVNLRLAFLTEDWLASYHLQLQFYYGEIFFFFENAYFFARNRSIRNFPKSYDIELIYRPCKTIESQFTFRIDARMNNCCCYYQGSCKIYYISENIILLLFGSRLPRTICMLCENVSVHSFSQRWKSVKWSEKQQPIAWWTVFNTINAYPASVHNRKKIDFGLFPFRFVLFELMRMVTAHANRKLNLSFWKSSKFHYVTKSNCIQCCLKKRESWDAHRFIKFFFCFQSARKWKE